MDYENLKNRFIIIILIRQSFQIESNYSYALKCPAKSEWNILANEVCDSFPEYYCIFDDNSKTYKEFCRDSPTEWVKGSKCVLRDNPDREICSLGRYQPFKFTTAGYSDCAFKKSLCSDKGAILHTNGKSDEDRTCQCDSTRGYVFVNTTRHKGFCVPSMEDCSCHVNTCDNSSQPEEDNHCVDNRPDISTRILIKDSSATTEPSVLPLRFHNIQKIHEYFSKTPLFCLILIDIVLAIAFFVRVWISIFESFTREASSNYAHHTGVKTEHDSILQFVTESKSKESDDSIGLETISTDKKFRESTFEERSLILSNIDPTHYADEKHDEAQPTNDRRQRRPRTSFADASTGRNIRLPPSSKQFPRTELNTNLMVISKCEDEKVPFDGIREKKIYPEDIKERLKELYEIRYNQAQFPVRLTDEARKDDIETVENELRIVLVGITGVGKSSTANMICGKNMFNIENDPISTSVTLECDKKRAIVLKQNLVLIDTPGLFEADTDQEKVKQEIERCKLLCAPKIDVLLFVITISRLTDEDIRSIVAFHQIFGENMTKRTIVVFTHGDLLKKKKKTFEQFKNEIKSKTILQFLDSCNQRCVCIDNTLPFEEHDRETQVQCLINMIQNLISNEKYEVLLEVHEQFIQEEMTTRVQTIENEFERKKENMRKQIDDIIKGLDNMDQESEVITAKYNEIIQEMEREKELNADCINRVNSLRTQIRVEISSTFTQIIKRFEAFRDNDQF